MSPEIFVGLIAVLLGLYYQWAFRVLPREEWQFVAVIPGRQDESGGWTGINLTGYGLFTALAITTATAILLILLTAVGVSGRSTIYLLLIILSLSVPASRLTAWLIEGKRHTFSVAGAVFTAGIILPWLIVLWNRLPLTIIGEQIPPIRFMAALVVAYSYGESLGRLACLSFGCCYGRHVSSLPGRLARLFTPFAVVFHGETKKVAYAGRAAGQPLVPVQALTATFLALNALAGTWLLLAGYVRTSLFLTLVLSQLWRFISEFLRDDYRGTTGKISVYQIFSLTLIIYLFVVARLFNEPTALKSDLLDGVLYLWSPLRLVALAFIFLLSLLYFGLSEVTTSTVVFRVRQDRI